MGTFDENTKSSKIVLSSTPPEAHRAYLIVLAGDHLGSMYEVRSRMTLGRSSQADIRFADDGVSRQHAAVEIEDEDVVIEDLGSRNGTFVNDESITRKALKDGDKIRIGQTSILKFTYHDNLEESFQRHLYDAALRDGLTNSFNKRYFLERLANEFAYARRHDTDLTVMMLDIDHFKAINDEHGHVSGDHVLTEFTRAIQDSVRCEDVFARFGGDEFAAICRGLDPPKARAMAERLRESIARLDFYLGERLVKITVSIGVASLPDATIKDSLDFARAADEALYAAKKAGRNQVAVYSPATS